jgi:subtilisin family serine protease
MRPFEAKTSTGRTRGTATPSEELRIAVTFRRPHDGLGPTKLDARLSARSVESVRPDPLDMDRALFEMHRRGFETSIRGKLTASIRGTRRQFEKLFGTKLERFTTDRNQASQFQAFYFPAKGAPWNPDPGVASMIDDAYIQWPHLYMARRRPRRAKAPARSAARGKKNRSRAVKPSPISPQVPYFHLDVPEGVVRMLNVGPVHEAGFTGKGVRIVMVDSGFAHDHPFFVLHKYQSSITLAPGATNRDADANGHGTGESANIFAVAPDATFIGVKVDNDEDPRAGASMLEGFQEALRHSPKVISISMGYDLRADDGVAPLTELPKSLVALEAEIQAAVAAGIIVVFSSGNGHYSFPGQMKEVISAGGVFADAAGRLSASDYASAFQSQIYSGRSVPDFCGLVGMLPHADYIALPVPPGSEIDAENAEHDATAGDDGWGVFSGTSAAAPQLAGVCALLLQKNPSLTAGDIKAALKSTARDVSSGHANPSSDPRRRGTPARRGLDGATGAGLVDAFAAWRQV